MVIESQVIALSDINDDSFGGKALGLKGLVDCGLNVPKGFVISNSEITYSKEDLKQIYQKLGKGKVAVRSSASDEDGMDFSSAGQYDSFLDIEGFDNLDIAVKKCIESATNTRSKEYKKQITRKNIQEFAVIIQKMVESNISGVLFTHNPHSDEGDSIVINAIKGQGELLVGGHSSADIYVLDRQGNLLEQNLVETNPILNLELLHMLVEQSLNAEEFFGKPLDLEWAIDKADTIHWLQARPITALNSVSMSELDSPTISPTNVFTKCNIGEMLPGAVTPLSISVFAEAIDIGMRRMYQRTGVVSKKETGRYICNFYNHLFMDFSRMYEMTRTVLGASKDSIEINVIGRLLPETTVEKPIAFLKRLINGIRYGLLLGKSKKKLKKIEKKARSFSINKENLPMEKLISEIDKNLHVLYDVYSDHYIVSAHSGAMNGILVEIISGDQPIKQDDFSQAALLLTNISDIESANAAFSLENLAKLIAKNQTFQDDFIFTDPQGALELIYSEKDLEIQEKFNQFLDRHGHRCIREAELREKDWNENPTKTIITLQAMVDAQKRKQHRIKVEVENIDLEKTMEILKLEGFAKKMFKWAYNQARKGVKRREYSKSLCIKIQSEFRYAYRELGKEMVVQNLLPDEDLIYFLTHSEIEQVINGKKTELISRAQVRRKLLPQQNLLSFPDVTFGKPEPISLEEMHIEGKKVLSGIPVSRGMIKGKVRIVKSIEDAEDLEPNEIMVASFTDIGWSRFYPLISGLITEIGGSLSHGAIIAREYGLPLVSSVTNATKILKTGQEILLDGNEGKITVI